MSSQTPFVRKIVYLVAILVLLVPLYLLGRPSASDRAGGRGDAGGVLAQQRAKLGLSESQLGEIDPASQTIRLATLGLRGVASNILWTQADNYKMKKDWTNLSATLQQIAKLEPHFIQVWRFQGWNLSYNVSAEFDDYRERYRWVMRGIDFLQVGTGYNKREPALLSDVGWFLSQKIGRADESKQFRRIFRQDEDFHRRQETVFNIPRVENNDNWLVGKEWYAQAEDLVDNRGGDIKKVTPVLFYSHRPMCQMNYADALEKDGVFGEVAERAFQAASYDWEENFGKRPLPGISIEDKVQLNDAEPLDKAAKECVAQLEAMSPGLRAKIAEERRKALPAAERTAMETPPAKRTERQHELVFKAEAQLIVTHEQLARQVPGERRTEALELARKAKELETRAEEIRRHRNIVAFEYWRMHARVEQTKDALNARKAIFDAERAYRENDPERANQLYDRGWTLWRKLLDAHRELVDDSNYGRDLIDSIKVYREFIKFHAGSFPKDFKLQDIRDRYEEHFSQ